VNDSQHQLLANKPSPFNGDNLIIAKRDPFDRNPKPIGLREGDGINLEYNTTFSAEAADYQKEH
jgi:hypothetical protein